MSSLNNSFVVVVVVVAVVTFDKVKMSKRGKIEMKEKCMKKIAFACVYLNLSRTMILTGARGEGKEQRKQQQQQEPISVCTLVLYADLF